MFLVCVGGHIADSVRGVGKYLGGMDPLMVGTYSVSIVIYFLIFAPRTAKLDTNDTLLR